MNIYGGSSSRPVEHGEGLVVHHPRKSENANIHRYLKGRIGGMGFNRAIGPEFLGSTVWQNSNGRFFKSLKQAASERTTRPYCKGVQTEPFSL